MINNKSVKLKVFFLTVFLVFSLYFFVIISKKSISSYPNKSNLDISTISPILIDGDNELSLIASSGDGSKSSPYIIKDLIVIGNGSTYGIYINNTTQYFILNNCSVTGTDMGIYLINVSNGFINSSRCLENKKYGIYFDHSFNNSISKSSVSLSEIGIFFYDSHNCSVDYCYFSTNSRSGISLANSSFNKISRNNIHYNNNSGITLLFSNHNVINNNSINNHNIAILLDNSNYNQVGFNIGDGNIESIVEINCFGNLFQENFEQETNEDNKQIIIDFTSILVFGLSVIILIAFIIKFIERHKIKNLISVIFLLM